MSSQKRRKIFRNKKYILGFLLVLLLGLGYWLFFYTDYEVSKIPADSSNIFFVNTQKLKRQYLKDFILNPEVWESQKPFDDTKISLMKSGIEIPDVLAFFQFPDSKSNEWFLTLPLKDYEKWTTYLLQEGFVENRPSSFFQKEKIMVYPAKDFTIIAWNASYDLFEPKLSNNTFVVQSQSINSKPILKNHLAVYQSDGKQKIPSFSIDLQSRNLLINSLEFCNSEFVSITKNNIAEFELRKQELQIFPLPNNEFLNWDFVDVKGNISSISAQQDTIVSYEYDENFNEVTVSKSQVLYNPEYNIFIKSNHPRQLLDSLKNHQWVNEKMEFVKIPFNINQVSAIIDGLDIRTMNANEISNDALDYSYLTIANLPVDGDLYKNLPIDDKWLNLIKNIDNINYVQDAEKFKFEIKLKPESLPLILLVK